MTIQDKINEWTQPTDKTLVTKTIDKYGTTIVVACNADGTYRVMRFFMVGDKAEVSLDLQETKNPEDVFVHLLQSYKL